MPRHCIGERCSGGGVLARVLRSFRGFQFEDTETRLLISLTISEDKELSDIKTPTLP